MEKSVIEETILPYNGATSESMFSNGITISSSSPSEWRVSQPG